MNILINFFSIRFLSFFLTTLMVIGIFSCNRELINQILSGKPILVPSLSNPNSSVTYYAGAPIATLVFSNSGGAVETCTVTPKLPNGLSLTVTNSTCQISGTPTSAAAYTMYSITAGNTSGTSKVDIYITVNDSFVAPNLTSSTDTLVFYQNHDGEYDFHNHGGPVSDCSVTPSLPSGLILTEADSTCRISGTPTVTSTNSYTFTATNQAGTNTLSSIQIVVNSFSSPPAITNLNNSKTYSAGVAITPLVLVNNGNPAHGCSVSPALPSGLVLEKYSDTCRITGTPTAASSNTAYTITATNTVGKSDFTLYIKVNNISAPSLVAASQFYSLDYKSTVTNITISNAGGKLLFCGVEPSLPAGINIEPISDSCQLKVYKPSIKMSNQYTITAKNIAGEGAVDVTLQVSENPANTTIPVLQSDGSWQYAFYSDTAADGVFFPNTGGSIVDCMLTPTGANPIPLQTGLVVERYTDGSDDGCVVKGTPTQITNGQFLLTASNSAGTSQSISFNIDVRANGSAPSLGSVGPLKTLYTGKKINEYLFANSGGAVGYCEVGVLENSVYKSANLPAGLNLIMKNGSCGVGGTPIVAVASTTFYFDATNIHGGLSYKPQLTIEVKRADEQTAEELLIPTMKYIEGSHTSFFPNQQIIVEAGKYYGDNVGNYLVLYAYGPEEYESNVNVSSLDFTNDLAKNVSVPLENYNIPVADFFISFPLSLNKEGYYRLIAAFCVSSGYITDKEKCSADYTDSAKSKVVNIRSTSSGGGGGGSGGNNQVVVSEDIVAIVEELQSKSSEELSVLESQQRSTRLQKAVENLVTRPASKIEGDLKALLDSNPSFASLRTEFPDVVRILEIFKDRYDVLKDKLSFPTAATDYDKARVAWEWLFPLANGHIIQYPGSYNENVRKGEFPYTFRNFLMATALYPRFCGEEVGEGKTGSEDEYKRLCTISMAESFAHFAQEVGGHLGDPLDVYTAPANGAKITAAKAGAAGGMKVFKCQASYEGQVNAYGFKLCNDGDEIPEWRQALYWVNESGCAENGSGCEYRECALTSWQAKAWPCPDGVKYFGRGAKQLSYNYNYGPFSEIIYGDVDVLLKRPSQITEGWLALASAVSFFMQPRPPKPSMFERIYGFWELPDSLKGNPKDANLNGDRFSASIMIINGGIECGGSSAVAQAANRVKYYFAFMDYFGITPSADQGSDAMTCANTSSFDTVHGASYDSYYTEKSWIGGCYLVSYETAYSGFFPGSYEKCIRDISTAEVN